MNHFCQKKYPDVTYGDGSIAENGCACCVMASIVGCAPDEIARTWEVRYWDNELGTLPAAFDSSADDFGIPLSKIPQASAHEITFHIGDSFALLTGEGDDLHYEFLHVITSGIERHDPRADGTDYLTPPQARQLIAVAKHVWKAMAA